jgi:hypothetical protein
MQDSGHHKHSDFTYFFGGDQVFVLLSGEIWTKETS